MKNITLFILSIVFAESSFSQTMTIHKKDRTSVDLPLSQIDSITFSAPDTAQTFGPVAYYPFNGNANDESGNGHNGTVVGATLTTDRFGRSDSAYLFNGVESYIDLGNSTSLNPTRAITIAVWLKITGGSGAIRNIAAHWGTVIRPGLDERSYVMHILANDRVEFVISRDGTATSAMVAVTDQISLSLNRWYFIAATWDGSTMRLYRDGTEITTAFQTGMFFLSSLRTTIGAAIGKGGTDPIYTGAPGSVDDVRFYNRALSEMEIRALFSEH